MSEISEINKLIIETIENCCDDENIVKLIKSALRYELDIWNRHVFPSSIIDQYEIMVNKVLRR